ncbi:MAG: hypothetical protein WBK08_13250 [Nitrospira sp.]
MKRFKQNLYKVSIIGSVALIYAALVVLSTGCALAHADPSQTHHHHTEENSSPQSAFCAWACQATSDGAAVAQPLAAVAWLVVEQQVLDSDSHVLSSASVVLLPRAPPSPVFLSHG